MVQEIFCPHRSIMSREPALDALSEPIRQDDEPPAAILSMDGGITISAFPPHTPQRDERYLETLKMYVSGFGTSPYGIEWMRFEPDSPVNELIRTVPHVAFEVNNLEAAWQAGMGFFRRWRRCPKESVSP